MVGRRGKMKISNFIENRRQKSFKRGKTSQPVDLSPHHSRCINSCCRQSTCAQASLSKWELKLCRVSRSIKFIIFKSAWASASSSTGKVNVRKMNEREFSPSDSYSRSHSSRLCLFYFTISLPHTLFNEQWRRKVIRWDSIAVELSNAASLPSIFIWIDEMAKSCENFRIFSSSYYWVVVCCASEENSIHFWVCVEISLKIQISHCSNSMKIELVRRWKMEWIFPCFLSWGRIAHISSRYMRK